MKTCQKCGTDNQNKNSCWYCQAVKQIRENNLKEIFNNK